MIGIILMFTVLVIVIFCIMKYKKTIHNSTAIQNENVSPRRKNIFKRMWDLRLKKRTDERAFENLHRTESEFSHVSNNNSMIELTANVSQLRQQSSTC